MSHEILFETKEDIFIRRASRRRVIGGHGGHP